MRLILGVLSFLFLSVGFSQTQGFESGELLIQLTAKANPTVFIRKFTTEQGIGIKSFDELSDIAKIYHLKFADENQNLDQAIYLLYNYPEVQTVQKNHFVSDRETIPSDSQFDQQWYLKNTGLSGGTIDADIDATDAWDITTGGLTTHHDTIVVCIIEGGGVDITHIDVQGNIWKNYGEIPDDGIDNDGNGYIDDADGWNVITTDDAVGFGSHGTRVAGMIGATGNNTEGVSGVNWNVKMMIVKGQQASNEATVIAAYSYPLKMRKLYNDSYGKQGAFVVATNSSWGIDNGNAEDSPLWCAMYDTLGTYGIISVGATTNNNVNVEASGDLPTNCTSEYFIGVTMSNNVDLRAGTGYGTTSVDLAAPGNAVRLPIPGDGYTTTSGTSFATPCVTGAVALAYSAPCAEFINFVKYDPAGAALQMRDFILNGVDPIVALGSEVATGGRLNVNNSINLMLADCDLSACIPPFNIRLVDRSDTSAIITWDGFTSDYLLTIQPTGGIATTVLLTEMDTLNLDTLAPCTEYTITIQADCSEDGLSETSYPFVFTSDGCCINPPMAVIDKTETDLTISWPPVLYASQYNLRYAPEDTEDWIELTDVSAPLVISDLSPCTIYDFQIYTLCTDSTRGFGESQQFRTKGCGACTELEYCPVLGANSNLEWIESISVNGVTKITGANSGWLRSEQIITALTPGESYAFTIVPGFTGTNFTERYSIYIDFDQNGVFDLPTDRVLADFSTLGILLQNITVPPGAAIGVTKLRIGMSALSEPVSCPVATFYGEYEDYCVYIGPQLGIDETEIQLLIYPNPATTTIQIESTIPVESVQIFAADGQLVESINSFVNQPIDIQNLSKGLYIIQVKTEQGIVTSRFVKS